jgi:acyl carrier protein
MSAITDTTAIQTRVFSALEELDVDPEKISRDADFAALDVDSLDLAELATIVDDEYGVKLRSDDMKALKTVGDVIDLVVARTA